MAENSKKNNRHELSVVDLQPSADKMEGRIIKYMHEKAR